MTPRRWIVLALAAVLALGSLVTACGDDKNGTDAGDQSRQGSRTEMDACAPNGSPDPSQIYHDPSGGAECPGADPSRSTVSSVPPIATDDRCRGPQTTAGANRPATPPQSRPAGPAGNAVGQVTEGSDVAPCGGG